MVQISLELYALFVNLFNIDLGFKVVSILFVLGKYLLLISYIVNIDKKNLML